MEGFLFVPTKNKFTRFWCVLQGQQLSQYAHLDLEKQEAVGIKAVHQIKNAKILKCEHQGKPYSLSLYCEGKKAPLYIDCGKEKNRSEWSDALVKAAVSHEMMERRAASVRAHMSTLGIPLDTELTPRLVSRAYKKLSLKTHPDKGGDEETFNQIRVAHTKLIAYATEVQLKATAVEVEYEAVIHKGAGVGLGIIVLENLLWGRVVVQAIQDCLSIRGISEEAEGEIRVGDSLYAIENDVCVGWPMSRIKARLNNFRVPVDTSVRLTFARRLLPDVDDDEPLSPLSSPNPSPRPVSTFTSFESFNEKNDHVNNTNEVNSPAADLSQHCNDEQEKKESSEKFNDMDGDMYDIDESFPDVTPEKESMVQECEQEKDASVLVTQCESSTPEHAKEEQRTGASTSNDNTNSSTFVHHLDLADSLMNEPPPDTNCVDNNAHIDIDENDCEVEDADREDYERQEPVEIAEHRNVVFKDTFDDNLRELVEMKAALKESQQREKSLQRENQHLAESLAQSQSQVRVLQYEARKSVDDAKKAHADISELQERCDALTTLLEDKIAEMKMDGFTDSSASRLQSLAKHASDATAYKRDLDIAISQLAALKLLVHGSHRTEVGGNDLGSPVGFDTSACTPAASVMHTVAVAQSTDALAAKLKKDLLAVLDI